MVKLIEPVFMDSCKMNYVPTGGIFLQCPSTLWITRFNLVYSHTYEHMNIMSKSLYENVLMVIRHYTVWKKLQIHGRNTIGHFLLLFYLNLV